MNRFFILLAICFILVPLIGQSDDCIEIGNFGSTDTVSTTVPANSDYWVNSNLYVKTGDVLNFGVSGSVTSCNKSFIYNVVANNQGYQRTSVNIKQNDLVRIKVYENDATKSDTDPTNGRIALRAQSSTPTLCTNTSGFTNSCWGVNGIGLNIFVGDNTSPINNYNSDFVNISQNKNAPTIIISEDKQGISFKAPRNGELLFSIADQGSYSDNQGGYLVDISVQSCSVFNGEAGSDIPIATNNMPLGTVRYAISNLDDLGFAYSTNPDIYESDFTGSNYQISAAKSGNVWLLVNNNSTDYKLSSGYYDVSVKKNTASTSVSDFIQNIINPINEELDQTVQIIYYSLLGTNNYNHLGLLKPIWITFNLYFIIYGIVYIFGFIRGTQHDFAVRMIKIGIVMALTYPDSYDFFYSHLFRAFKEGGESLIQTITGDQGDMKNTFGYLDQSFGIFLSDSTWKKMAGLLLIGAHGLALFVIIAVSIYYFILFAIEVVIAYLLFLIGVSILFSLAPLFIIFVLFERTREMFENWIKYMALFMLQPVIIFSGFVLLNLFLVQFFYQAMTSYSVCWGCAIPFYYNLNALGIDFSGKLFCINGYVADSPDWIATFTAIIMFLIVAKLTKGMAEFLAELSIWLVLGNYSNWAPRLAGTKAPTGGAISKARGVVPGALGQSKEAQNARKQREGAKLLEGKLGGES